MKSCNVPVQAFRVCLLPLVDFLIFDVKVTKLKDRNAVRYTKDQTTMLVEDALNVYQSYSSRLKWSELFKLVKSLIYKIEKASRKTTEESVVKSDYEHEKVLTKCLCKVLEGFAKSTVINVPDAVDQIAQQAQTTNVNELSTFLAKIVSEAKQQPEQPDESMDSGEESVESSDESVNEFDIIQASKSMADGNSVLAIQQKLALKVLPHLMSHLAEIKTKVATNEVTPIRSYVAVCIAKLIRKLPVAQFNHSLNKLINIIVAKGLRAKDLATREKARKALLKVVGEVSPRFLSMIVQQMKSNLNQGY